MKPPLSSHLYPLKVDTREVVSRDSRSMVHQQDRCLSRQGVLPIIWMRPLSEAAPVHPVSQAHHGQSHPCNRRDTLSPARLDGPGFAQQTDEYRRNRSLQGWDSTSTVKRLRKSYVNRLLFLQVAGLVCIDVNCSLDIHNNIIYIYI